MTMTGRERFLTVLENGKPDRLPCQVHGWMPSYLESYLGGKDAYEAYAHFNMDPVIYVEPHYVFLERHLADWDVTQTDLGVDADGNHHFVRTIRTPSGDLRDAYSLNRYTVWVTEHPIKDERDFEIWNRHVPLPDRIDWTPVLSARERIGDSGITRGGVFDFGQGSPWQSFVNYLYPLETAILDCFDRPEWIHHVLSSLLAKKLSVLEHTERIELDLVETGGGAGSSTVISPDMHAEFCLPYDRIQHAAIRQRGTKVVYHLCGGIMPLLDLVAGNGANGLETMTPPEMGGDCDLAEASRRVGDRLFFIGGFDQNAGFENGDPSTVRDMVLRLFRSCPDGGYICSPSDHFFFGHPDNIRAFAETVRNCLYQ